MTYLLVIVLLLTMHKKKLILYNGIGRGIRHFLPHLQLFLSYLFINFSDQPQTFSELMPFPQPIHQKEKPNWKIRPAEKLKA